MIILLNGPFGVGKTSVAMKLCKLNSNFHLYDPEELGKPSRDLTEGIRAPEECSDDFQDIRLWESMVIDTALALKRLYQKDLVVPMTFDKEDRLHRVISALDKHFSVYHYCLTAPYDVIQKRLIARGEHNGDWPMRRAKECCDNQQGPSFEEYIDTSSVTVEEIAMRIMTNLPKS